jgi:iron complex outermembrane receptor protein
LQYRDWNQEVNWKGGSLWASYIQDLAKGKFKLVSWIKPEWRSDRSPIVSGEVGLELPFKLKRVSSQLSLSGSVKSRMPSANDLYWIQGGNPDLLSEKAKWIQFKWDNKINFETKKSIQFQINAKAGNVENWIQWLPMPEDIWLASNLKSVSMKQIEAVSTLKLPVANDNFIFSVRTELTRTTASNIGSPGVFNIVYTPQVRASANAQYTHGGWSFMFSNSFVSKRFTDEGNTDFYALPFFNLFNVCLNRDLQMKENTFSTQFEIQNVFNTEYQWIRGYAMPGRVYSLSFKFFIH